MKVVGGMANRQIARDLRVNPVTIDRHISRLARQCMLFHRKVIRSMKRLDTIIIDGFESFEFSQYFPFQHHVAVEAETGFFVSFSDSELRRKGRMTPSQKLRRSELEKRLGRPDPRAIEKDIHLLLEDALTGLRYAIVRSDDHWAYPLAIKKLNVNITHLVTKSRERRTTRNPLWEVNLLDLLIRHSQANHKRETISWSKRRQASSEKLAIFLVWKNYIKKRREKRGKDTPAMLKGLMTHPLRVEDILSERLFRTKTQLPPRWAEYYDRLVKTRALSINRTHNLKYAY